MLVAIIADTHLTRDLSRLPSACRSRLEDADLILHAGDIVEVAVLEALEALGPPIAAVHGNVDSPELRRRLPARLEVKIGDLRVGMTHDAGRALRRLSRLQSEFPDTRAVVFGHSHIPLHQSEAGFHIFNPGSPTDRRREPVHTMGLARLDAGGELRFEHVALG